MLTRRLLALGALALVARGAAAASVLSVNSAWLLDASVASSSAAPVGSFRNYVAAPLALALKDLQRDWHKVIGIFPTLIAEMPSGATWGGDAVLVFALAPPGAAPAESFTVVAGSAAGGVPTLTVTGADVRGLIYGIFHVSADFLGVDPHWWFNDVTPVYEPAGVALAPTYSYDSGAPAFDSRGGFNNDEDLSGYFRASPLGDAVYDTFFADRFCETLLRLRVNTFIPSTFAYIDESHYRVAAMRGLRLGNHHVMPVANNVYAWPYGVSYAYRLNPGVFLSVWQSLAQYALAEQGRDMVFSLGYRVRGLCVVFACGGVCECAVWVHALLHQRAHLPPQPPPPPFFLNRRESTTSPSGTWILAAPLTPAAGRRFPRRSPTRAPLSRRSRRRRACPRRAPWRIFGWSFSS